MSDDPDAPYKAYWLKLGEFTHYFTVVELRLFYILCAVSQVSFDMGKALFSGARCDGLISFIRRGHVARGMKVAEYLDRALQQAAVINGARNDLIHHWTFIERDPSPDVPPKIIQTNKYRYPADKAREAPVSAEFLDILLEDILTIMAALKLAEYELTRTGDPAMVKILRGLAGRPWKHKSPVPT